MGAFTPAALEMVSDKGAFASAAPVGRQSRGVLHTPPLTGRKTRRNVPAFTLIGALGGRMLLRPTWVHIHDKGVSAPTALEMVSDRGAFVPAAAVGKFSARFSLLLAGIYWGFAPYPPPSFLPLMEEKKAKEDQAPTGGGEVGRVRVGVGKGGGQVGRVRVGCRKRGLGKGPGTCWGWEKGVGKLAGDVLDMGKGDAERGRVLDGGLSLFLVLGDQQQLVSFV